MGKKKLLLFMLLLIPIVSFCQHDNYTNDTIIITKDYNPISNSDTETIFITVKHKDGFLFQKQTFDKACMTILIEVPRKEFDNKDECVNVYSDIKNEILSISDSNGTLIYNKSDNRSFLLTSDTSDLLFQLKKEVDSIVEEATVFYCHIDDKYPHLLLFYLSTPLLRESVRRYYNNIK